jgi:hypothetical protein
MSERRIGLIHVIWKMVKRGGCERDGWLEGIEIWLGSRKGRGLGFCEI